ncbi:dihydrolipoyl dehydrogenase [Mycoplasmatota bacterium]|nr:dihydrolipoyl dehydrogenase [Mycoplasmatota bacterium]
MAAKITIDKLSGHDREGRVGKINVHIGDEIKIGDQLFTIESGKGTIKFKSPYEGVLLELDIEEGDKVKINQVIGLINSEEPEKAPSKPNVKKKAYSFGLNTPSTEEIYCDVVVVGGGPGGYVAAIRAAQLGLNTVLIEKDKIGGTCLNYGCIPTKALVQSTSVLENIKKSNQYGFKVDSLSIDFESVIKRKDEVVEQLVTGINGLMDKHNIRVLKGEAVAEDKETLNIKTNKIDITLKFNNMILALGASPKIIPIEGTQYVLTSKEILELKEIPKSLTIIGGGIIGMEIAFIYNALGTDVSVIEYIPRVLSCLDSDVSEVVRKSAIEKGINIYDGAKAVSIKKTINNQLVTEMAVEEEKYLVTSEKVLMAVGRKANLDSIDLNMLGVDLNETGTGVKVNEYMRTSNEKIYAIGDLTDIIQLAHVASHQGIVAAEHISGLDHKMDYSVVPSAIFTSPEVGTVGISEAEAYEQGINVNIVKFPFIASGKALAMNKPEGFIKLIADKDSNCLVGGAIVGGSGTELIATISNLIYEKTDLNKARKVIYAHPTLSEGIHEGLLMLDERGIHFG